MKKLLLGIALIMTGMNIAYAQSVVRGQVTDASGDVLPGVGVLVKGTANGTVTDENGNYSIKPGNNAQDTLIFSCIGMTDRIIPVKGRGRIDVTLDESRTYLDGVVVIGYGQVRRSDLTGSIASVSSESILRTPANNVAEAITGKLAGVQVLATDGAPDAEISMYVRGRNSITQSSSPLYIVDGFPVSSIADIAPTDIQSIDVLKDASSTAIYGSRGANGVIMITTKSASRDGISASFNLYLGLKYVSNLPEVLDPYEFALWQYEQSAIIGDVATRYEPYFGSFKDIELYKDYKGNDWQDIVFGRSALVQNYNVTLNGKTEKVTWSASYSRQADEAVMITSDFVRDNLSFKFQHRPNRKLAFDYQMRFSSRKVTGSGANEQNERSGTDTRMRAVMQYTPIPMVGVDSSGMDDDDYYKISSLSSPTEFIRDNDRLQKNKNLTLSGGLTWQIVPNLFFKANLNYDLKKNEDNRFYGVTTYYARQQSSVKDQPAIEMNNSDYSRFINYNTLSYDFKSVLPKKHKLNILLGEEMSIANQRLLTSKIDGFPTTFDSSNAFKFTTEGTAVSTRNYYYTPERLLSFFSRISYGYDDRYLFNVTLRADGSSKFKMSQPWGFFPSAAFAWKISSEPFMSGVKSVSTLKLRLSYGISGNDNIPSGQTIAEYSSNSTTKLPFGTSVPYWSQGNYMSNPDLVWETTTSRNVGLDFGFFRDRLSGTIDAYMNTTDNLLISFPIKGTGYTNQYRNMGKTQNSGFEVTLNAVIVEKKDYGLTFTANVACNRNKVITIGGLEEISAYSVWASSRVDKDFVVVPGMSMGQIYGYEVEGRYSGADFNWNGKEWIAKDGVVDNSSLAGSAWGPGAIKLKDQNDDGIITPDKDRKILGCTLPKAQGGFAISGYVHGVDINANFSYTVGNKILNANKGEYTESSGYRYQNTLKEMDSAHRWRSIDDDGNRITDPVLLDEINAGTTLWTPLTGNRFVSSYMVEDGSFLRLNSLTVGYTFPSKLMDKIKVKQLRLYVTGTNLFCWTKYTGFDPEVDTRRSTPMTPGVDYSPYPRTIGWIAGLNLTF